MKPGDVLVLRGDARRLPLADESVDLIVTSPPYFSLRDYRDGSGSLAGQIGAEPTPGEYIDALLACTREWVRVLKPSGSLWVNLGDKYSSGSGGESGMAELGRRLGTGGGHKEDRAKVRSGRVPGTRPKSQLNLPERYRIGCTDQLGLIQRAKVVWSKPNGLPESVTDRVRCSHEDWVHLTKEPRYFSAVDAIREQAEQGRPQAARAQVLADRHGLGEKHRQALLARGLGDQGRSAATQSGTGKNTPEVLALAAEADAALGSYTREFTMTSQSLGKLPGSVWQIPTEPLKVPAHLGIDHFAAFPTEWPRRLILGWSPSGICTACGEGRRPVSEVEYQTVDKRRGTDSRGVALSDRRGNGQPHGNARRLSTITGEVCACPEPSAPTRPSVILDPFGGTGTTALVASVLGRTGISVDLSADYCRLATWRTTDPGERARAMRVPKPDKPVDGQLGLFDGAAS